MFSTRLPTIKLMSSYVFRWTIQLVSETLFDIIKIEQAISGDKAKWDIWSCGLYIYLACFTNILK